MCVDCRSGDAWDKLLGDYRLKDIVDIDGGWRVESASGKVYTVSRKAGIDRDSGGMFFVWRCDCPARKRCRHCDAVEQMLYAEAIAHEDYDGLEIIERCK